MLHVAILSPSLSPFTEAGRLARRHGEALAQRGWRVDFLCCKADSAAIAVPNVRLLTLPETAAAGIDSDYLDLAWRELFRDGLPDVIVDAGWPSMASVAPGASQAFTAPVVRLLDLKAADEVDVECELMAIIQARRACAIPRALILDVTRAVPSVCEAGRSEFEAGLVAGLHEIERCLLVSWDERLGDYRLPFADEVARLQASGGPEVAACLWSTDERISLAEALAAEGLGLSDVACLLVAPPADQHAAEVGRWFADRLVPYSAILQADAVLGLQAVHTPDPAHLRLLHGAHCLIVDSVAAADAWRERLGEERPALVVEATPGGASQPSAAAQTHTPASGPLARRAALRQVRSRRDHALACRAHAMAGRVPSDEIVSASPELVSPVQTFLKPSGLEWEELLYPGKPPGDWQMSDAERMALTGLLARWRPKTYLEIGTFYGGSALLAAQFAEWVITIDIDPYAETRFVKPANLSFIAGRSQDMAADLLDDLAARDAYPDFILIDGDHSAEGVRRDLNIFLGRRPQRPTVIVMHDSFNPGCREGMRTADWAGCPWVRRVELDFVPGRVVNVEGNPFTGEMWGGLAVAILTPEPNPHGAMIFTSAQDSFDEAMAQSAPRAA